MTARWPISHSLVLDSVAALAAGFAVTVDTEEDTEHDDQRLDHHGEPVLLTQRGGQSAKDHEARSRSSARS